MRPWYQEYWRLISHPYAFFEETLRRGDLLPGTFTFLTTLIVTAFGWTVVSTVSAMKNLLVTFLLPLLTYPAAVLIIYSVCRFLIRETNLRSFFAVWGFSYLPTFVFFCR